VLPPGSGLLSDPTELYGYASHDADGKLIPSYRPAVKAKDKAPVIGDATGLVVEQPDVALPPLMKLAEGEVPAIARWEQFLKSTKVPVYAEGP